MLILLPPSETKTPGGTDSPINLKKLHFGKQTHTLIEELVELAESTAATAKALKLSAKQAESWSAINAGLLESPTMPAIERYTGVLYSALAYESLHVAARDWVSKNVFIHSALFGIIPADLKIPNYRLSADSKLTQSLKQLWNPVLTEFLTDHQGMILDARSTNYVKLATAEKVAYLNVVTKDRSGKTMALNHFNKAAKGKLVRALALAGQEFSSISEICEWANASGIHLEPENGGLVLTVSSANTSN